MSLRLVPHASHPTSTSNTASSKLTPNTNTPSRGAPSAPGLPDTLRLSHSTPSPTTTTPTSTHPLETRLKSWTQTQQSLQHTLLRRTYGLAEPLRRGMELKLVRDADSFRPSVLGKASGVHEDILCGRDGGLDWEDVYNGQDGLVGGVVGGGEGEGKVWVEEIEGFVGMGRW